MFDPTVWGTVAAWTGSLLTGLSVVIGVGYYVFDRRRERHSQAGSVVVWLHPHEHGPPLIKVQNLSDRPVFDHGWIITSIPNAEIAKLDPKGEFIGPFDWPKNNELSHREGGTFINYHDGSEVHLAKDQTAEYQPDFRYAPGLFRYYVRFRDAAGRYWVVDANTQRPLRRKATRALLREFDIGQRR